MNDAAMILESISKSFDGGAVKPLVRIDLEVPRASMLAITGASGSGKTTLLNVMALLDSPSSGSVAIDGRLVRFNEEKMVRRLRGTHLGFVFQDALLDPDRTALENVLLGLRYAGFPRHLRRSRAAEVLEETGTSHRSDALGRTLSGGERQRVAVARAIAHRPAVLLCDEPTGNLDEENTGRVFELLKGLSADGTAVVMVTHDMGLAQACQDHVRLAKGTLQRSSPLTGRS